MLYKITLALLFSVSAFADGNTTTDSFSKAKRLLQQEVYADHRTTIYCEAEYTAKKSVIAPDSFTPTKHVKRSKRIEWEHVVPADIFNQCVAAIS